MGAFWCLTEPCELHQSIVFPSAACCTDRAIARLPCPCRIISDCRAARPGGCE